MRLLKTQSLTSGMKLGKTIFNERGIVLLSSGVMLTNNMIKRLIELDIPFVYIEDGRTLHIKPNPSLPDKTRNQAVLTIQETFSQLNKKQKISDSFVLEKATKKFTDLVRSILTEVNDNKELLSLLTDVYAYDHYIFTHSLNVALYSLAMGLELKLNQKQMEILGLGAIMHDVGKMMIPTEIILKPGRLTEDEFETMKKHSEFGFQLLRGVHTIPLLVAHCAYQHHERLDGTGYPRGLNGEDIHFYGKIIAVADVFDAVTSNRVYRNALLPHEALEILYSGAGTQFDVKIIEAFRRSVAIYPVGLMVELSDGRKGIVSKQNTGMGERPIIEIIEEQGNVLEKGYELDLLKHNHLVIKKCHVE